MRLSESSTVYQYKLQRRIPIHNHHVMIYAAAMLLAVVLFTFIEQSLMPMLSFLLGFILLHFIYFCITLLDFVVRDKQQLRNWKWRMQWPWFGLLPTQIISVRAFSSVHMSLSIIGLAFIISLLPWITPLFFIQLLFLHAWILLPRFIVIMLRIPPTDLVKLDRERISHYKS